MEDKKYFAVSCDFDFTIENDESDREALERLSRVLKDSGLNIIAYGCRKLDSEGNCVAEFV